MDALENGRAVSLDKVNPDMILGPGGVEGPVARSNGSGCDRQPRGVPVLLADVDLVGVDVGPAVAGLMGEYEAAAALRGRDAEA